MRAATRLLVIVAALIGALLTVGPAAHADPSSTPSADPTSNDYNPRAWMTKWGSDGVAGLPADIKSRLEQTGMVVASTPEQFAALTPADVDGLTQNWSSLISRTWGRTQTWATVAANAAARNQAVPEWSSADSDSVAKDLGAANYAALSPGLKSVAQRIATIVTGDYKPAMPDDAWASWMPTQVRAAYDARPATKFDWKHTGISVGAAPGVVSTCGGSAVTWLCEALSTAANTVGDAADFVKDPFGWIASKMAAGAAAMWGWVAGLGNAGTAVDLSSEWWVSGYVKAMAVGIILALLILVYQFGQLALGRISGQDLLESIVLWTPAYLAGIVFGPALGQFFVHGSTALTDAVVGAMKGFSASETDQSMKAAFDAVGAGKALGGVFVGIFVLIFAVIGVVVLFCSLAIQSLAVYMSSALFAVGFAWVVSVKHRGGSYKIPLTFLAILFSRPVLFFILGLGLGLMDHAMTFSDEGAQNLANLIMGVVAIFLAAFAPLVMLKWAPVSPAGSPATGGAIAGGAGAAGAAAGGSLLAGLATRRAGRQASAGAGTRGGRGSGGAGPSGPSGLSGGAGAAGPSGPSGPSGGSGVSGANRVVAAGASGPGTARPAGLQRQTAAPGGPPSAAGQRLARDTGQPLTAGTPVRKPATGARPASPAPGGSSGAAGSRGAGPARRAAAVASSTRRWAQSGHVAARDAVEGLDGDQRWESLR